ncbi:hypothetical protein PV328_011734 [Microctonus aethiopoides]|uniref:CCHC-type domain-containing protein n=1 Tax=Microctonus aethiopoides TaxID=144406 RepID=A0AA39FHQ8_9HYME|nr:hypothetical protein PV328_011734 [Microctonus aethiopoides]
MLSNIDKLNYISHALENEDARAMQQLGISKAHYDHAWVKLNERYENSERYIEHHTQSLCELAPMSKNTYVEFRRMMNNAKHHLVASERYNENHAMYSRAELKALDVPTRAELAKEMKLCFSCLYPGHQSKSCIADLCKKFNKHHKTLLHRTRTNIEPDVRVVNTSRKMPAASTSQLS